VEGVNMGGFLLGFLAVLVFGAVSLLAVGLLLARLYRAARIVFACGLCCATVIAALAALSFLAREYHPEGNEVRIVLGALTLLLVGAGPLLAAFRSPGAYGAALGCAAGALVYGTVAGFGISEVMSWRLPGGAEVSLILAACGLLIAVFPPPRPAGALLWAAQAILGGIAGYAAGGACGTTRSTALEPPGGRFARVRVEVYVLGVRVSDETRPAEIPDGGPAAVRSLSLAQDVWLSVPPAAGAAAGIVAALGLAAALLRRSGKGVHAEPLAAADWPREHGSWSDRVKPA
jgi:hypothetical protein